MAWNKVGEDTGNVGLVRKVDSGHLRGCWKVELALHCGSLFRSIALVTFLVIGCARNDAKVATPPDKVPVSESLPSWAPDVKMLDKLADETDFENYKLRPLKGYSEKLPREGEIFVWFGPART